MSDELTPEQRFALDDPSAFVPRALSNGTHPAVVIENLVRLYDWDYAAATNYVQQFVDELSRYHASPESRRDLLREYRRHTFAGICLIVIGLGGSVVSFATAAMSGRGGILFYGAIIVGIVLFCRGVSGWTRYRRAQLPP